TGINVTNAADLPGKLAKLISDARTTPPDPATLLSSSSGGTSLFSLFVGATVPTPEKRSCDNSATRPEFTNLGSASVIFFQSTVPCLNLTVIPAPSATDPQFLVKAKDANHEPGPHHRRQGPGLREHDHGAPARELVYYTGERLDGADTAPGLHRLGWQAAERLAAGQPNPWL